MKAGRVVAIAGTAGLAGFIAFIGVRRYIRGEVVRTLREDYQWDAKLAQFPFSLVAGAMNLPSAEELADSLVPLWSVVGPYAAIEDVLKNGRTSVFWPEKRRAWSVSKQVRDLLSTMGLTPEKLDKTAFQILSAVYQRQHQLEG